MTELPAGYAPAGIRLVRDGPRAWLSIERTLSGTVQIWSYDPERDRWRRGGR